MEGEREKSGQFPASRHSPGGLSVALCGEITVPTHSNEDQGPAL